MSAVTQIERNQATALWAAADSLRQEAEKLRADARALDEDAARLDRIAAATADGRSLSEA